MKKLVTILAVCLCSCGSSVIQKETPKESITRIVATYITPKGNKAVDLIIREIVKTVKYDSIKKKDIIYVDTLYGYPVYAPLKDSSGKIVYDSANNPKVSVTYKIIGKDSVNWQVQNISVDSLLK